MAGKVAFVIGGSKGSDGPFAIGLAEAGAKVAVTGRAEGNSPSLELWDETIGAHIRGPFLCSIGVIISKA